MVGQVNKEYEIRDQCMAKYVSLINLQLGSFEDWRLEHVPRRSDEKENILAIVATSLPIKETVLLPIHYQPESSITTNQVNEVDETSPWWMTLIFCYLNSRELSDN